MDPLEKIFDYMFLNSDVNFNQYRNDLTQPTPEKDLTTFVDQMQRVSIQVNYAFSLNGSKNDVK